jgi:hypothetical protein
VREQVGQLLTLARAALVQAVAALSRSQCGVEDPEELTVRQVSLWSLII